MLLFVFVISTQHLSKKHINLCSDLQKITNFYSNWFSVSNKYAFYIMNRSGFNFSSKRNTIICQGFSGVFLHTDYRHPEVPQSRHWSNLPSHDSGSPSEKTLDFEVQSFEHHFQWGLIIAIIALLWPICENSNVFLQQPTNRDPRLTISPHSLLDAKNWLISSMLMYNLSSSLEKRDWRFFHDQFLKELFCNFHFRFQN